MATITGCTLYKNLDGSIDRYVVDFSSSVIPAGLTIPQVNVRPEDLTDPTDLAEVKTVALAKIALMEAFVQKNGTQTADKVNL